MTFCPHQVNASRWLEALERPEQIHSMRNAYGADNTLLRQRALLISTTLRAFMERFGNPPVRLFRAPGRVNLRGMHVDTHGGWLNLMTHQREVVLVAASTQTDRSCIANVSPDYCPAAFTLEEEMAGHGGSEQWFSFISSPEIRARVAKRAENAPIGWANYLIGAALRIQTLYPDKGLSGLNLMVHSDLPRGAALSSSAALSLAALLAFAHCNGHTPPPEQLIPAEQDVEWYAGARVGMSDQAAILLGRRGAMLHIALHADDLNLAKARYVPFPQGLQLIVVNSCTTRTLSGADRRRYSLNRFAYSMALPILQTELRREGHPAEAVGRMNHLSRITPDALGGISQLYRLLERIPATLSLGQLRRTYDLPDLDAVYEQYFGGLAAAEKPQEVPLRGPLLFGIAESARAKRFAHALETADYACAGKLMSTGHDGDRIRKADGTVYETDLGDAALRRLARQEAPIEWQPGAYGASSPALDTLVDTALTAGALGASLTGAGIAGTVLVLCLQEDCTAIMNALRRRLQSASYAQLAPLPTPMSAAVLKDAVLANQPVTGAGELHLTK